MEQPVGQKKGFFDRPVRLRIVIRIIGVLILVCVAQYGIGVWRLASAKAQSRNAIQNEIRHKGEALAQVIAVTSREDVRNSSFDRLQDYFSDLVKQPDVQYLIVQKLNGEAAVHTDAKFRGKKLNDVLTKTALDAGELTVTDVKEKELYDIAIPVMNFTSRAAIIRIGVSYGRSKKALTK
jgi:hypothetical protein